MSIGAIALATAVVALLAPPADWDSMTCHMARVAHWMQNRSVAFYPTSILRQLHQNPWAEYAILHLQILSGSDGYASLVQWFSMIGSLAGVSLIAMELGAGVRAQALAALIAASIPMGVVQSSTTQNDYAVTLWLVCVVYFAAIWKRRPSRVTCAALGCSLGLAILTKATAYVYAFPFVLALFLVGVRRLRWAMWRPIAAIAAFVLLINFGHGLRNYALYANPLGPGEEGAGFTYTNELLSVRGLSSNIIRNTALHVGTPAKGANAVMEKAIVSLHSALGINASDRRTTFGGAQFHVPDFSFSAGTAGNPIHLLLVVVALLMVAFASAMRKTRGLLAYAMTMVTAFMLFCFILKWQPWGSRLQLPLFVLWSPVIAIALLEAMDHRLVGAIAAVLLLLALRPVVPTAARSLLRGERLGLASMQQYSAAWPDLMGPYGDAVTFIASLGECPRIGLLLEGNNSCEYPFWVLLKARNPTVQIEHVGVTNVSAALARPIAPCIIVSTIAMDDPEIVVDGRIYLRAWSPRGAVHVDVYSIAEDVFWGSTGG
ncbi:MAG TPA: glycosyltransferase family 39 protein [Anaerolineae bacterium]|nr:glycosyltransferase family 39 protein [Anaerolineae bacterium]HPL26469.1 glycosyltransferase family 39 protein [Anaerolineae bacterium]